MKFLRLILSVLCVGVATTRAGSVIIVANGASTGPIITTSAGLNIDLGTQIRVGAFGNSANLTTAINTWNAGTTANSAGEVAAARTALFNNVLSSLNSNFTDLGTGANYGSAAQTSTLITVDATKFLLNTQAALTINGTSQTRNVANGQITPVTFSAAAGIGNSKQLYMWTAFNNEIGIFTDSTWVTPSSDLSNATFNLNSITLAKAANDILLGNYLDNATGNDFLRLGATSVTIVPEPSTFSLLGFGSVMAFLLNRRHARAQRISGSKEVNKLSGMQKSMLGLLFMTMITCISYGQTVSTPVVGFYKQTYPAGASLQTVGFLKTPVYSGVPTTFTSTTLTFSGASLGSLGPVSGMPAYYVEVRNGNYIGYTADILSNTSTSVTIDGNLSSILNTQITVAIRPHTKLSEALRNASSLGDYDASVTVYNSDGTQSTFLKDSSVTSGWLNAVTFSESDAVIYPNSGFILNNSTSGNFTQSGAVRDIPSLVPLYANQVNIVALAMPDNRTVDVQGIGLGTNLVDYADSATTYRNDGSLLPDKTILWAGSADNFLDAVTFTTANGVNVSGLTPIIVSPTVSTTWKAPAPITQ